MKLTAINTGCFKLDGGAMFGVVPRRMWEKMNPPDGQNLCTWSLRGLLVETEGRRILIDTGMGNKQDAKFRSHFEPHGEDTLFGSLEKAGVGREEITDVLITHLHFDHCGGALWKNERSGEIEPAFPNAVYWSNQRHFEWALHPNPREKASFLLENFLPLYEQKRLKFIEVRQNIEWVKNIRIRFFNGHTEAMMSPLITTGFGKVWFCTDLIPSQWHIGLPYVMAYDVRPLKTMIEKARMLEEAVRHKYLLFLQHDPAVECARVEKDGTGRIGASWTGPLGV